MAKIDLMVYEEIQSWSRFGELWHWHGECKLHAQLARAHWDHLPGCVAVLWAGLNTWSRMTTVQPTKQFSPPKSQHS